VVDIQARARSAQLADILMENYLQCTGQQDELSRAVLAFYLVEKAIVGAAISIVYDNVPDLGWDFLAVAEMRLQRLGYSYQTWWINRPALYRPTSGRFFVMRQSRQALSSPK